MQKLLPIISELKCLPEQQIIWQGDVADRTIYFIQRGEVELFFDRKKMLNDRKQETQAFSRLGKGQYFGEQSFFARREREFSVRCTEFTVLFAIKYEDFLQIVQQSPEEYEKLKHLQDRLELNQEFGQIQAECQSCFKNQHLITECPMLHFVKNRMQIIQRYRKTDQKDRNEFFQRNDNSKFNALLYLDEITESVAQFIENNTDVCNNYEELMQNDDDFVFHQRRVENVDREKFAPNENQNSNNYQHLNSPTVFGTQLEVQANLNLNTSQEQRNALWGNSNTKFGVQPSLAQQNY